MQCAEYDTCVTKKDECSCTLMLLSSTPHEKSIVWDRIFKSAGQQGRKMTQVEWQFCPVQQAPRVVEDSIKQMPTLYKRWKVVPRLRTSLDFRTKTPICWQF
jgi:hypothetical protein